MMLRCLLFVLLAAAAIAAPLPHDVYVWQRAWKESVREAVVQHGTNFQSIVVLGAEVTWKNGQPQTTRVAVNYDSLRAVQRPVGIALRIGPSAEPFRSNDAVALALTSLAKSLIAEATANGARPVELQLDFDCAESKLDGYRVWVETISRQIAPVPLVITALPSWLRQPAFVKLAAATDGYILQVHSLERPKSFNAPFSLCNPAAARRYVEQAGRLSVPFRVALPTYGYYVAYDSYDRFIGLAADGPAISWPAGARIREVRADAAEMAKLVAFWNADRPANLRGVIWYRLSTTQDILNWRFATLGVVVAGRVPQADLRVESRSPEPELVEVILRNDGTADFQNEFSVRVRVRSARVVAGDSLGGFDFGKQANGDVLFRARELVLRAGEQRKIGWLRTNRKAEVELAVEK